MELRELAAFREVARLASFNQAAARLGYVQSTVSAQVQSLERDLGVRLFDRLGRSVTLTSAGQALLPLAEQVLDLAAAARGSVTAAVAPGGEIAGTVTLSAPETLLTYRVPRILSRFRREHPGVAVVLRPTAVGQFRGGTRRAIANGSVDIAFVLDTPLAVSGFRSEILLPEPISVIATPGHRLATEKRAGPGDLDGLPILLPEAPDSGCAYRAQFERQLADRQVTVASTLEFASIEAVKQCVVAGMGISVLPSVAVEADVGSRSPCPIAVGRAVRGVHPDGLERPPFDRPRPCGVHGRCAPGARGATRGLTGHQGPSIGLVLHSRPVRVRPSHQSSACATRRGAHTRTVPTGTVPAPRPGPGSRRRGSRRNEPNRRSLTMPSVSMRQLLEAGVHFGHQTRRWNPKMRPFIFAERNGIHIIDLAQTVQRLDVALDFVRETVARGDQVLFVGTKKQAQEPVAQEAARANQPYVNKRWLGGMLTNFTTIKKRIGLLEQLEARQQNGDFERMTKKEAAKLTEEMVKLQGTLGGMRKMKRLPGAIFIVDPHRERIGVTEANKLEIPVVGTGDTNVDPDELDFIIPANDDAIRAIRLLCTLVADAAIEGAQQRSARSSSEPETIEAMAMPETEEEEPGATDELVAALAGGAALSFEPDVDEDDLLPGDRVARAEAAVAEASARRRPPRRSPRSLLARRPRRPRRPAPSADHQRNGTRLRDGPNRRQRYSAARRRARRTGEHEGMADITASLVKELRERTGAGFMDCKQALVAAGWRPGQGGRAAAREGPGGRRQEGQSRGPRGPDLELHPHRRPGGRAHRGQLRDRLRGPDR